MSWLQALLDRAAAAEMCVKPVCTTCGALTFRAELLGAAKRAYPRDMTARGWTLGTLRTLAVALAELPAVHPRDEEALRLIILHLHHMAGDGAFTDEFSPGFSVSPANSILASMRVHHAAAEARRAAHDHRNSPEGIAEAKARRKAAGEQRAAEHRAHKEAREAARRQQTDSEE